MNQLQRVELELLKAFIEVCRKLDLTYYLVCGSALGAVKYGGFIPWDDDIDVALPRRDYERFCAEAKALLPDHIFVQNYRTDPYFPMLMTKLRDCRTTFIENMTADIRMNHGVYIDIFPLDGYPDDPKEAKKVEREKKRYHRGRLVRCTYNRFRKPPLTLIRSTRVNAVYLMYKLFGYRKNTSAVIERFDRLIASYPCENSALWCNHANWQGKLDYSPGEHFGRGESASFEGVSVRIPKDHNAYLTQKYGDWRADLPMEKRNSGHNIKICDLDHPYTDYL